jgi:hypothetical protein
MSAKKNCVSCGKQIPSVALVCVFCSTKQPAPSLDDADDIVSLTATEPTMVGFKLADLSGAREHGDKEAGPSPGSNGAPTRPTGMVPPALEVTQSMSMPVVAATPEPAAPTPSPTPATQAPAAEPAPSTAVDEVEIVVARPRRAFEAQPWASVGRLIMGIGGAVLVALFFCPWHGVSSWQLLETLAGADFVRQLFYLTGGVVLVASALLPLPFAFRAFIGAIVAATPVLLGAGGVLDGWRGVAAAIAILGLPATHLLRSREQTSVAARRLVLCAVAAVALLYLLPEAHVVPIVAVFKLIFSGSIGLMILGIFILAPLVFASLSLLGVTGRDLTDVGVLLSVLILLWAPVVVALRGVLMDDSTQLYVALALLWASATAALSWAQLLSLAAGNHDRA